MKEKEKRQYRRIRRSYYDLNIFYIIYAAENIYKLPVAYCENTAEVARFLGLELSGVRCVISRHRRGLLSSPLVKDKSGKYFFIKQWRELPSGEIEEIKKGIEDKAEFYEVIPYRNKQNELKKKVVYINEDED